MQTYGYRRAVRRLLAPALAPTALALAALTLTALTLTACAGTDGDAPGAQPSPSAATAAPTSAPPSTAAPSATPPSTVAPATPASPRPTTPAPSTPRPTTPAPSTPDTSLRPGDQGPQVLALQQRLVGLGYWLGNADGRYGSSTQHAVTAFQKVNRLARDGVAGPQTMRALATATRAKPRSSSGRVIEVDLSRQVLLLAIGGRTQWVFDTSTGVAPGTTPVGHHQIYRQVNGYDTGPLGTLYRPKYFHRGVAVHGYPNVPPYPASHGCVRVTNAAMDWLWSSGSAPIGTPVWVY